jgi:hypothetical protein
MNFEKIYKKILESVTDADLGFELSNLSDELHAFHGPVDMEDEEYELQYDDSFKIKELLKQIVKAKMDDPSFPFEIDEYGFLKKADKDTGVVFELDEFGNIKGSNNPPERGSYFYVWKDAETVKRQKQAVKDAKAAAQDEFDPSNPKAKLHGVGSGNLLSKIHNKLIQFSTKHYVDTDRHKAGEDDSAGTDRRRMVYDYAKDALKQENLSKRDRAIVQRFMNEETVDGQLIVSPAQSIMLKTMLVGLLTEKVDKILARNSKMQHSGGNAYQWGDGENVKKYDGATFYHISVPALRGFVFDEKVKDIQVVKTCPFAGDCVRWCYASFGNFTLFIDTGIKQMRSLTLLHNRPSEWKNKVVTEIKAAKANQDRQNLDTIIRWHDSGDFFSENYLKLVFEICRQTPDVRHYAYTKSVKMLKDNWSEKPANLEIKFSIGGQQDKDIPSDAGISTVLMAKDFENMKNKNPDFKPSESPEVEVPVTVYKSQGKNKPKAPTIELKMRNIGYDFDAENKPSSKVLFKKEGVEELKDIAAKSLSIPRDEILTWDELVTKYPKVVTNQRKWRVLVFHGHGDEAGLRPDVKQVILLQH